MSDGLKYEYETILIAQDELVNETEAKMNEMGAMGWECFAVTASAMYFKRKYEYPPIPSTPTMA
jgi:hypothetical protein